MEILHLQVFLERIRFSVNGPLPVTRQIEEGLAEGLGGDGSRVHADPAHDLAPVADPDSPSQLGHLDGGSLPCGSGADDEQVLIDQYGSILPAAGKNSIASHRRRRKNAEIPPDSVTREALSRLRSETHEVKVSRFRGRFSREAHERELHAQYERLTPSKLNQRIEHLKDELPDRHRRRSRSTMRAATSGLSSGRSFFEATNDTLSWCGERISSVPHFCARNIS